MDFEKKLIFFKIQKKTHIRDHYVEPIWNMTSRPRNMIFWSIFAANLRFLLKP
jgi:hypothetical protein